MLITLKFKHKTITRPITFNPENVLYVDVTGVLFEKDVHRLFADGEYDRFVELMRGFDSDDIIM